MKIRRLIVVLATGFLPVASFGEKTAVDKDAQRATREIAKDLRQEARERRQDARQFSLEKAKQRRKADADKQPPPTQKN